MPHRPRRQVMRHFCGQVSMLLHAQTGALPWRSASASSRIVCTRFWLSLVRSIRRRVGIADSEPGRRPFGRRFVLHRTSVPTQHNGSVVCMSALGKALLYNSARLPRDARHTNVLHMSHGACAVRTRESARWYRALSPTRDAARHNTHTASGTGTGPPMRLANVKL